MTTSTIHQALIDHAGLGALVGDRIYRGRLPQSPTYPLIMFVCAEEPENLLIGESESEHHMIQLECYATSYTLLDSIKEQLKRALYDSSDFVAICTAISDDQYQDEQKNYSIFLDFSIWFQP